MIALLNGRRINDSDEHSRVDWKFIYTGDCWLDMGAGYFWSNDDYINVE